MKKIIALVVMMAFLAMVSVAISAPAAPATDIKIVRAKGAEKKPVVTFSHVKHAKAVSDCKTCHHTWDSKDAPKKCSECHAAKKDGKKIGIKNAAHKRCRSCHRDMKKAGKKTGPTPCKGCHKK